MLVKNSTQGVKKVLERYISIDVLKFQNRRLIYGKIVKNELLTIDFRPIMVKDVEFFVGSILKNVVCNQKSMQVI